MESEQYCSDCLDTHDQERYDGKFNEHNYEWLHTLGHGKILNVWFKEPANSTDFRLYTTKWWKTHCRAVSHGRDLYEAHVKAFVAPGRFAAMFFHFEDGSLIEATAEFYRLEQNFYDIHALC